jgi:multicomponent Na+:H+ antiporter subunit B
MPREDREMGNGKSRSVVVETVSRLMVPFIQLFALYVIIHGAGGPGGGFQGGVIFASSFVLLVIAFGIVKAGNRFPERANIALFSTGVYLYAGVGLLWQSRSCTVSKLWVHSVNTPF